MSLIYLDYNASTPIDPAVVTDMQALLTRAFGNPSSQHWAGGPAKAALEKGRGQVAALLNCAADEVIITSGGSESNNLALKGIFFGLNRPGPHIITCQVEHPAILTPCRFLERLGATVSYLPVDGTGRVDPDAVRRAITPRTVLVTLMHANNEVGTIQPIAEISRITRDHEILFHTDAAQSAGKIPTDGQTLGVDLSRGYGSPRAAQRHRRFNGLGLSRRAVRGIARADRNADPRQARGGRGSFQSRQRHHNGGDRCGH